ncbi:MAG TPA: hypothetical protein VNW99_11945 [Cytophagaceae bacterium]|jgi:hypothetical protein|nr:hypothetical protein [Cytophagaceae bacterium]
MKNYTRVVTEIKYLLVLILITIIFSCKRDDKSGYIGPELITAPSGFIATNFTALPNLPASVNFAAGGTVIFTANFSTRVTYIITLTGLSSTARKVLKATGSDPSGVTWDGDHDGLYYFRSGEKVEATLTFFNSDIILKDTVQIAAGGTKKFGVLINSYEAHGGYLGGSGVFDGRWPNKTTDPGINDVLYGDTASLGNPLGYKLRPIEGTCVYTMDGIDHDGNYYLMSALQEQIYMYQLNLTSVSPDNLYFNIYIYSYGVTGSRISINFEEDDAYDITNPFVNHNFDQTKDDVYKLIMVLPDKVGWYLYSVKYSDIPLSADANEGMNGNKIHEPQKLWGINLVHLSLQPGIHSKLSIDNARFTIGKSLPPIE